jgi:hypothetical protein
MPGARTGAEWRAEEDRRRDGGTEAGRNLEEHALTVAVAVAAIRHRHTDYDGLLSSGIDRKSAREGMAATVKEISGTWRARS